MYYPTLIVDQVRLFHINDAEDKYLLDNLPQIDCLSLIHLCHARCCTLVFALSQQDLHEGVICVTEAPLRQISRRVDGFCVHNTWSHECDVYSRRPAPCRMYDCRNDPRIWRDFERKIPAVEEEHPDGLPT
jgi:hypothetical protein